MRKIIIATLLLLPLTVLAAPEQKQPNSVLILGDDLGYSSVSAGDGFPEFSWDHVPLYAHLGIGAGLPPEQYNFLADHFKLITFTGGIVKSGSVEPNIAAAARAIKQRNPQAKVLFYWASDMPKHQWKQSNATFPDGGYLSARKRATPNRCSSMSAARTSAIGGPAWRAGRCKSMVATAFSWM